MNHAYPNRMLFQDTLKDLIDLFEKLLSNPQDSTQLEQWKDAVDHIIESHDFTDQEQELIDLLVEQYEEQHTKRIEYHQKKQITCIPSRDYIDELLNRKQHEQRTLAWYQQMATIISASELGSLFASPRERAKLVLSKTVPYPNRNQTLAVTSDRMSAFDWGIRFEPVVKQIYEYKYGTTIKELGRLTHSIDHRCTASPDGLVYSCPLEQRTGRLIEIKCPVSRKVDGIIPPQYYDQMQMQLHVTGLFICDFVEAVFSSKYNNIEMKDEPGLYHGLIAIVRYAEPKNGQDFYYVYSPLQCEPSWTPVLSQDEELVEITPWKLQQWSEQMVKRNEEWWTALQPVINTFWEDVEKAKQGEFTIPDSTRATKVAKKEPCLIQFHKVDEYGQSV
jgi:YqaJ-like viral recombinase domain